MILTSIGFIPREAILFLTGLMVFYMIFSSVDDSLYLIAMSIPFFVALPMIDGFDSMANWRILIATLFLCLFFKKGVSLSLIKNEQGRWRVCQNLKHGMLEYLMIIFLAVSAISIFFADYKILGIKKILFLINIFLLFLIIKNIAQDKDKILKILQSAAIGGVTIIGVALFQFLAVLFVPLYTFWQFWAGKVIVVFYGQNLSDLLSYSNTWFAYYPGAPPTLRLFSVFPDSHSFAMFLILMVPIFLALAVYSKNPLQPPLVKGESPHRGDPKGFFWWTMTILALFGIIMSGSRGAWLSVLPVIAVALYVYRKRFEPALVKKTIMAFGLFVAIFLLSNFYPPMLYKFQSWQSGQNASSTLSFFQRAKSISDLDEVSNKGRLQIWQASLKSLAKYPILGVGLGNFVTILDENISTAKKGASAHNLYLDVASEIGIFGALVLAAIFLEILRTSWLIFRRPQEPHFKIFGLFFGLYFFWVMVYSLFDVVMLNDKVMLLLLVGLGSLYSIKSLQEKNADFGKSVNL